MYSKDELKQLAEIQCPCYVTKLPSMLYGLRDVFLPADFACINTRGSNHKLIRMFCHSNVRKYFFNNRVVDAWNSLTNEIIISPSVSIFKTII